LLPGPVALLLVLPLPLAAMPIQSPQVGSLPAGSVRIG
jgi:hypothetical protein